MEIRRGETPILPHHYSLHSDLQMQIICICNKNTYTLNMARITKKPFIAEDVLKENELKNTPLRAALLTVLAEHNKPMTVAALAKKVKKLKADTVTIYRALHAFVEKDIVIELSLNKTALSYELKKEKKHRHHIICQRCAIVEPIDFCIRSIEQHAKEKSRLFNRISEHTLSFVGTCRKCVRAVR